MSRFTVNKEMTNKNVSLFLPKKDQCDLCCSYTAGNLSESDYLAHIEKKNDARDEKSKDKLNAIQQKCIVLTMDLEAVKLAPNMKASALYYKTKLAVHNFTIYNLATHHCTCYWWNESEGDLVASTFASCVVDYLDENCLGGDLEIIIYSDGCTYQNRNVIMATALLDFAERHKVTITQKFLEKGHTQMECDSVHSAIETKLRHRDVHLPSDYTIACKEARLKPFPYNVKYITHEFFLNFARKESQKYDSIRPGSEVGDPTVFDLRAITYKPTGIVSYKLNHKDNNWQELPRKPRLNAQKEYGPLLLGRLPIGERKWKDLQDLKSVLPSECHSFYNDLPHL